MSVHVLQAAKFAAVRSDWTLSNLELQKIIYIAHMFHLGIYETPLVDGDFEAWDLGPVHPILYHHIKRFGAGPVTRIRSRNGDIEDGSERTLLEQAVDSLRKKTGSQLVAITHWNDGAWARNYRPGVRNRKIPQEDIIDEYRRRTAART